MNVWSALPGHVHLFNLERRWQDGCLVHQAGHAVSRVCVKGKFCVDDSPCSILNIVSLVENDDGGVEIDAHCAADAFVQDVAGRGRAMRVTAFSNF